MSAHNDASRVDPALAVDFSRSSPDSPSPLTAPPAVPQPTPAALAALDLDATENETIRGITWLALRDGHVVLERCPKKARVLGVGEWFVPGGKLERGETPEQALRREFAEEWPFVEMLAARPLPIIEGSLVGHGQSGLFLMRPYVVVVSFSRAPDGVLPDASSDGVALRWVPVSEALASPVPQVRMMVAAALSDASQPGRVDEGEAENTADAAMARSLARVKDGVWHDEHRLHRDICLLIERIDELEELLVQHSEEQPALLAAASRGAGDTEAIAIIGREATALIELVREARLGQERAWALTSALGILGTSAARAAHPEGPQRG